MFSRSCLDFKPDQEVEGETSSSIILKFTQQISCCCVDGCNIEDVKVEEEYCCEDFKYLNALIRQSRNSDSLKRSIASLLEYTGICLPSVRLVEMVRGQ